MPLVGTGVIIGSDVGASEAEGAAVGFGVAVFVSLPPPPPPPPPRYRRSLHRRMRGRRY